MKEMREFFEELLRGDSISEVLRRNKMQVVKLALVLVAAGVAGMWLAIFADVGVMVLAVLNAVRALILPRKAENV